MSDFIRARSEEQKAMRLEEIKAAAERLFESRPYHAITLTVIAEELGWSRASLYKYVTTKEEVFLSLMADKRDAYTAALLASLPEGCGFSRATVAEVWAGIANAHRDFFRYGDLLYTVIETNVSVDRLVEFKSGYYESVERMRRQLPTVLNVAPDKVEQLANSVYHQGIGLCCSCMDNPLVREAVERLGVKPTPVDFRESMRDFIEMSLAWNEEGSCRPEP